MNSKLTKFLANFTFTITVFIFFIGCGGNSKTPDLTPPMITLNGGSEIILFIGDEYIEQGAIAIDDRDGSLVVTTK